MIDLNRYRELFQAESTEHLLVLNRELLRLEADHLAPGAVEESFRSLHTLKGMAAAMGFEGMAALAHALESLFAWLRQSKQAPETVLIELALAGVDAIDEALPDPEKGEFVRTAQALTARVEALLSGLSHRGEDPGARVSRSPEPGARSSEEALASPLGREIPAGSSAGEVPASLSAREVPASLEVPANPSAGQVAPERASEMSTTVGSDRRSQARDAPVTGGVRVRRQLLDKLLNRVGELMTLTQELEERGTEAATPPQLRHAIGRITKLASQMQRDVLATRTVPVETIFERLPRAVRDVAQRRGKRVEFIMTGREIELDRAIVEEIAEPLMHLVRNAVDHGIEPPDERAARGKPAAGRIQLAAFRERQMVVIEVSDDGRGLDRPRLREAARTLGVLSAEQLRSLSDDEVDRLAIVSGLSTAATLSETSGRGVGLDAVQAAVTRVGGILGIRSSEGRGATFSLRLPLTLAVVRSLLVESEGSRYALPMTYIGEVVSRLSRAGGGAEEGVLVRGERLGWRPLAEVLEGSSPRPDDAPESPHDEGRGQRSWQRAADPSPELAPSGVAVILEEGTGARLALGVDRVLGIRDIVVRRLQPLRGAQLPFNGVTVLSDGGPALLVDVARLTAESSRSASAEASRAFPHEAIRRQR